MEIRVAQVRLAVPLGGLQQFTVPGFGTPKFARFTCTLATAEATTHADAGIGVGFTDGTRQFSVSSASDDNVADSNTCHRAKASCALCMGPGSVLMAAAEFRQWVTDGVEVNWINYPDPATGMFCTCLLIGGDDFSVYVGDLTASATVDTETNVTAPGFLPDVVMLAGTGSDSYTVTDSPSAQALMMMGLVNWDGVTVTQCSLNWRATDAASASFGIDWVSNQYAAVYPDSTGIVRAIEVKDFDASGFSAWTRVDGGAFQYIYAAMSFGGRCAHWVGNLTSPIVTGNKSYADPNFRPQAVLTLPSGVTSANAIKLLSTNGAGTFGIHALTAGFESTSCIGDDDAAATMDTESFCTSDFQPRSDTQTSLHVAGFVSFDATGWTWNFTTADGTARVWPALVIGEFVGRGPAIRRLGNSRYCRPVEIGRTSCNVA